MNEEEKRTFVTMQSDITQIKQSVAQMGSNVDKMYFALMGNELSKDGGLVRRIQDLEQENEAQKEKIEQIERKAIKTDIYVRWVWALASALITSGLGFALSVIFKN